MQMPDTDGGRRDPQEGRCRSITAELSDFCASVSNCPLPTLQSSDSHMTIIPAMSPYFHQAVDSTKHKDHLWSIDFHVDS
jgi:hypothetical protein